MYTTLEALKAFAGLEDESEDDLLNALIGSATDIIEGKTHRKFVVDDETAQAFSRVAHVSERFSGQSLFFYEELAEEASAITDSPTVIYLPEDGPPYYGVYISEGSWAYPTVTVTGYWGYSRVAPPSIEIACLRLSKWLYDMKDTGNSQMAIFTPEGQILLPQGLPDDVLTILKPYIKVVVA